MKHPLPTYRPFGEPAFGVITVNSSRTVGDKVTINGTDFTLGTHFGLSAHDAEQAELLAGAINGGQQPFSVTSTGIVRPYFAYFVGNSVVVVATAPGTGGNAITLAETGASFSVSGATLSGGTSNGAGSQDAGVAWTPVRAMKNSTDLSTISDLTVAPTSGQKIVLDDLLISVGGTAMTLTFTEETSGTVLLKLFMPATSGAQQITLRNGLKVPTADKKIRVQSSAAGDVFIHSSHHSEA